jgi:hypothetical protein
MAIYWGFWPLNFGYFYESCLDQDLQGASASCADIQPQEVLLEIQEVADALQALALLDEVHSDIMAGPSTLDDLLNLILEEAFLVIKVMEVLLASSSEDLQEELPRDNSN